MTFTQLRCFIEVARQLNFARAAETLYISQPAVSRQIHALENELGVRLFDRTRHVVALTSAGESFYHDTVDMLDRLTLAVQRAQNTQALFSEELHVGYSGSMQIQKLPQIYQQYQKRCPQCGPERLPTAGFIVMRMQNSPSPFQQEDGLFVWRLYRMQTLKNRKKSYHNKIHLRA